MSKKSGDKNSDIKLAGCPLGDGCPCDGGDNHEAIEYEHRSGPEMRVACACGAAGPWSSSFYEAAIGWNEALRAGRLFPSEENLRLYCVYDGEERHFVSAYSAFDAMRVCAENWGDDTWTDDLAESCVQVTPMSENAARNIFRRDDETGNVLNLWEVWKDSCSRCLIGWTGD